MSKYTPGQWYVSKENPDPVTGFPVWAICSGPSGTNRYVVAKVYKQEDVDLLGASGELLAALKALFQAMSEPDPEKAYPLLGPACRMAQDAIVKAEKGE